MKCFVTGASGFIGSNLVKALRERGFEVIAFVRKDSPLQNLKGLDVEIRFGDILDYESLKKAMEGAKFVFHTAAVYKFWERDYRVFYDVNVKGTRNVLDVAKELKVERVVFTSTTGAIGASRGEEPIDETAIIKPPPHHFDLWKIGDHYARSKILAQQEVLKRKDQDIVIVCPSAPIGWGDIKPTPTGLLILKFLRREIPFYSDVGLSLVNVRDVVDGHIKSLEKGRSGEIYILAGENKYLSQIFDMLSEITGLKKPIKLPRRISGFMGQIVGFFLEIWAKITGNPPLITRAQAKASLLNLFYSSKKAEIELGYKITPLKLALKDAVKFFIGQEMVKEKIAEKIKEKLKGE